MKFEPYTENSVPVGASLILCTQLRSGVEPKILNGLARLIPCWWTHFVKTCIK